jgi:large subunit ribosomal protein L35
MPRAYKGKKTVKLKSNRGAAKRFRAAGKKASGKKRFKCFGAKRRHQMTCKTTKMKRHARTGFMVRDEDLGRVEQMLPYA